LQKEFKRVDALFKGKNTAATQRDKEAVIDGTSEVMLPVTSSAVTIVLAFIPMLIMTGSTGDFFAYIPKTVTFALIASLVEALFILPIHFPQRPG
jgi:HAE1 family hydrophobic/amphiphilic exporter-1